MFTQTSRREVAFEMFGRSCCSKRKLIRLELSMLIEVKPFIGRNHHGGSHPTMEGSIETLYREYFEFQMEKPKSEAKMREKSLNKHQDRLKVEARFAFTRLDSFLLECFRLI